MATVRRKISELTALNSASLDTTVLGVDNGTTYKIELDTLADAVTSRVNILDRNRLSALETYTSSFSASAPAGTISSSAQITSLGFISSSISLVSLNSYTSSQDGINIAFTNGINSRLTTSSFNQYTASVATTGSNTFIGNQTFSGSGITYTASLQIGDYVEGGKVGYIWYGDTQGATINYPYTPTPYVLIIDTEDLGNVLPVNYTRLAGATYPAHLGYDELPGGYRNTIAITGSTGAQNNPAKLASDSTRGGYTDWFLPNVQEWNTISSNLSGYFQSNSNGHVGNAESHNHWTSEADSDGNYTYYVVDGSGNVGRYYHAQPGVSYPVRAIRRSFITYKTLSTSSISINEHINLQQISNLNYSSDSAAAVAGVQIYGLYHTNGTLKIRLN